MFLTLLLLGLGVSYYCLRRRPIPIVRRVVHVGSGSEITALESGSIGKGKKSPGKELYWEGQLTGRLSDSLMHAVTTGAFGPPGRAITITHTLFF